MFFFNLLFHAEAKTVRQIFVFSSFIAYEQAPSEGGKQLGERSVNPRAKRVGRTLSSPDRSRFVPLALDHTRPVHPKPNR